MGGGSVTENLNNISQEDGVPISERGIVTEGVMENKKDQGSNIAAMAAATARNREQYNENSGEYDEKIEFVEVAHWKMIISSMKAPFPQEDIFQWRPQH